ncbi:hypothetical protein SDC9_33511 [bioreactor metagenome]|uniref:Uncharacterized protein n=2 Tax=root TaxID=1 RepID=A0A098B1B2_DESHA|nr:hypothetical protein [Desulfitobacterium hafniense]MEA5024917.1 hypothetical protein [Desulfitobacterium hafniense]CDX02130.1 Hypothetical protein DPCES_2243 [Desulfitobacterium hafniense]
MFIVNSADYTILVIGVMGALLAFAIQFILCFKAKHIAVKCIPIYVALLGGAYCLALWAGLLGSYSAGAISGNQLVALILGVVLGIASSGIGIAWILYGVISRIRNKQELR